MDIESPGGRVKISQPGNPEDIMPAIRCQTCHEAISSYDFYLNLPQGPVCSSCLVNRACGAGDFQAVSRVPARPLAIGDLEALYPRLRPAPEGLAAAGTRRMADLFGAAPVRCGQRPAGDGRDVSALDEGCDDFWAMPGFSGKPA